MELNRLLIFIERSLLHRMLTIPEMKVIEKSWQGHSYKAMEKETGYSESYLKDVGSQLWQELSQVLGERVSKRNFVSLLSEYDSSPETIVSSDPTPLSFPGGAVPVDSSLYVQRPPAETLAYQAIHDSSCLLRLKASRQMGKTSLLLRVIAKAKQNNYQLVFLDLQAVDTAILSSFDRLAYWVCSNILQQLHLSISLETYWQEALGSKFSYRCFLEKGVFPQLDTPFLLIFDELDQIFEYPTVVRDFLPLLRACYEQSKSDRAYQKARLVLSYSTEMYIPLQFYQSPFNVGLPIQLPPFNTEQTLQLAQSYNLNDWENHHAEEMKTFLNGHPYLLNVALYHLYRGELSFQELRQQAEALNSIFRHHLQGYLAMLKNNSALRSAMEKLLATQGSVELDAIAAYQLEGLGLITIEGKESRISCDLYRRYFQQQLLGKV